MRTALAAMVRLLIWGLILPGSNFKAGRFGRGIFLFPKPESAEESIRVVNNPAERRQFLQFLGVSSADSHLVWLERCRQMLDDPGHVAAPLLLAALLQRAESRIVLKSRLLVGEVRQLH